LPASSTKRYPEGYRLEVIVDVFREYSIEVELVPGDYTSKECSICGARHKTEGYIEVCIYARRTEGRLMLM
jgi:transposase